VAARGDGDEHVFDDGPLADDEAADFLRGAVKGFDKVSGVGLSLSRIASGGWSGGR